MDAPSEAELARACSNLELARSARALVEIWGAPRASASARKARSMLLRSKRLGLSDVAEREELAKACGTAAAKKASVRPGL